MGSFDGADKRSLLSKLLLLGGSASCLGLALWHRYNFFTEIRPRRRFVQNAIISDQLDLFEAEILSSARLHMMRTAETGNNFDAGTTAVLDKFEIAAALEKLAMALDMDVDRDLLVRYKHAIKYVICVRMRESTFLSVADQEQQQSADDHRPRSYRPFDSVLTHNCRRWLELARVMEKHLDEEHVSGNQFIEPSLSVIGFAVERGFIERLYRREGKKATECLRARCRGIALSACWNLLVGGFIAPGRRREASRNRTVRLLVAGAVFVGIIQLYLGDRAGLLQVIAESGGGASQGTPLMQLASKLRECLVLNGVRLLVFPVHGFLTSKLSHMLNQELRYTFTMSVVTTDQAFSEQPAFGDVCDLSDADRTVRTAVVQVLSSVRVVSSAAYFLGLFGYSVYVKECPLLLIGILGGYVFTAEHLSNFWKTFVLGSKLAVMERCDMDLYSIDERALPARTPLLGLCLLGNVLASHQAPSTSSSARTIRDATSATRDGTTSNSWTNLSFLILASVSDKHDCIGPVSRWQAWARETAVSIRKSRKGSNSPSVLQSASSCLLTSFTKDFRFIVGQIIPSWPSENSEARVSDAGLESQYLDLDESLMLRRAPKYIRVENPLELVGYDPPRFLMLRCLGVEVVHMFKSLREKRVMYQSRLKKETMDAATNPDSGGGFSLLLDELALVGLMVLLFYSLQGGHGAPPLTLSSSFSSRLFHLKQLLLRCPAGMTPTEALKRFAVYQSCVATLAHRLDRMIEFGKLIDVYEVVSDTPRDMLRPSPCRTSTATAVEQSQGSGEAAQKWCVALQSVEWREGLQKQRPELRFDVANRISGGFVLRDAIRFEKVYFSYPSTIANLTLNAVSFSIPASSFTGIIGKTGSGKSTVLKLLKRLYDPFVLPQLLPKDKAAGGQEGSEKEKESTSSCGRITFDGIPISCFETSYLRSLIATVDQKPQLFQDMSILENIAFFRKVTKEEVVAAAKRAQCHNFIMTLPMQYDTLVSREFSGGEMQRIAIARALVVPPIVLFLDEATSSLDAVNEKRVQATIDDLADKKGTTIVAIAHRLSTLKKASHFVVLMKGECIQEGSHEKLIHMADEDVPNRKNMYRVYMKGQALGAAAALQGEGSKRKKRASYIPQEVVDAVKQKLINGECSLEELALCVRKPTRKSCSPVVQQQFDEGADEGSSAASGSDDGDQTQSTSDEENVTEMRNEEEENC